MHISVLFACMFTACKSDAQEGEKKAADPPGTGVTDSAKPLELLGTKSRSSARTASATHFWAIFPAPTLDAFKTLNKKGFPFVS